MSGSRWWMALAVGVLALSGCALTQTGAGPEAVATTTVSVSYGPAVDGMVALAWRTRLDDAAGGRFQIKLTNTGSEQYTVLATSLDSPGFIPLPPSPRETLFRPGARIDMPTPYGPVICDADVHAEPAYAALEVLRPDGTREQLRVPLPSDYAILTRIHDEECLAEAIAEALSVELIDAQVVGSGADQALQATLRLTRRAGEQSIAITDVVGSMLYDLVERDGIELPVVLAPDQSMLTVPIQIAPATCAPHVIAETKKPFTFPLWLSFDGAERQYSEIPTSAAQRELLPGVLVEVCDL